MFAADLLDIFGGEFYHPTTFGTAQGVLVGFQDLLGIEVG